MNSLRVKKLNSRAITPTRATSGSAGYDLCACIESELACKPHTVTKVPTGIAIELADSGYVGLIYARSGLATKAMLAPVNCVGVIDSDYRGELIVAIINHSDEEYIIKKDERIAQLVITPIVTPQLIEVAELLETERGEGGFGSTGKGDVK